ncbi:MAG: PKD domain-containing protein [Methanoregulaceae archaeon]|nr:PKD domain-containing protein [Methanoregulaceae archaeon]
MRGHLRGCGDSRVSPCRFFIILLIISIIIVVHGLSAPLQSPVSALHTLNLTTAVRSPVAGFSADITTGVSPLTVHFSDTSLNNPTSWLWDLNGDGRIDSQSETPQYIYHEPGTYTVTLTVASSAGKDEETRKGYILVTKGAPGPIADFSSDAISGTAPLTVRFTDRSVNDPLSWEWDFNGDGRIDSKVQNPSATYSEPGIYSVRLTVKNDAGSDEKTRLGYISVTAMPEAAAPVSPVTTAEGTSTGTTLPLSPSITAVPPVKNPDGRSDFSLFLLLFITAVLIAGAYLLIRSRSSCSSGDESRELHLELSGGIDFGGELPPLVDPAEPVQPGSDKEEGT